VEPADDRLTVMDFPLVSSDDEIDESQDDDVDCVQKPFPDGETQEESLIDIDNNSDEDDDDGDLELDDFQDVKVTILMLFVWHSELFSGRGRFSNRSSSTKAQKIIFKASRW
jgi:hypothetical protein